MDERWQQFFALLGVLLCSLFAWRCLGFLKYVFPRAWRALPPAYFQSMGQWAVVTGAGDGIGKAYSLELARRGLNVVMISRTLSKLQAAAAEIEKSTGQQVKVVQADFTRDDIYDDIEESLKGLEIGILVNNVGMLPSPYPRRFLDGRHNYTSLVNCNMLSVMQMTRLILPQMLQRKKGLILNISSGVGSFPCPLYSAYSSSKAFVAVFSKALQAEYKSKGIIIQVIMPYGVSTAMSNYQETNVVTVTPADLVRQSLNYVTFGEQIFGTLSHEVLGRIIKCIPLSFIQSDRVQKSLTERIENLKKSNS